MSIVKSYHALGENFDRVMTRLALSTCTLAIPTIVDRDCTAVNYEPILTLNQANTLALLIINMQLFSQSSANNSHGQLMFAVISGPFTAIKL